MFKEFRKRFWRPPRAHGEVIEDRSVSFLELFYDLVYVVVIASAAATLAHEITWRAVGEFVVIFSLIWLAWTNGTFLHDLHGREDIRTRAITFAQMLFLVWLAVYIGDAAHAGGQGFALIYAGFIGLLIWPWYSVRRLDDPIYDSVTGRYLKLMAATMIAMFGSAWLQDGWRVVVWAVLVVIWLLAYLFLTRSALGVGDEGLAIGDSLVERFGLFIIIVLGEVVVGVVDGLRNADREPLTMATGLLALAIGFGLWWNYFDLTGRRHPRNDRNGAPIWIVIHLPLTLSIAAAGAAMVVVVEHATDSRVPLEASWLLAAAVSLGLLSLSVLVRSLADYELLAAVYEPTSRVMMVAALVVLVIGSMRPPALLLVFLLAAIQAAVWVYAVTLWLQTEDAATTME